MKKILLVIIMCFAVLLVACDVQEVETRYDPETPSMFVKIESGRSWYIVYQKDTKVMYAISAGGYNCGTFTLLVDADGNPLIWKG